MNPVIQTKYGPVMGFETEHAYVFLGIPYAKAERFQEPEACEPWKEVRECLQFPPQCPQAGREVGAFYTKEFYQDPAYQPPMEEDCLYLNLWMPKWVQNEYNPVAVWIHGGAFLGGHASEMEFDGEEYAKRGVVLVTVQYRLGMFGFFGHPELKERYGYCGNYGIMDQMAAIDWVRENALCFSGNPDNITVFGQSAGGMSVKVLVSSPLMKGKFHKAILQSCGGYRSPLSREKDVTELEYAGAEFLKEKEMTLDDLLQADAEEVDRMGEEFNAFAYRLTGRELMLSPVIDDKVLFQSVDEAAAAGETMRIPYMIGAASHDIFFDEEAIADPEKNRLHTSARDWCLLHEEQGIPCYHYFFSRKLKGDDAGAFHSAELWYMFGTWKRCWRPMDEQDAKLSEQLLDAWASFMRNGDPGWERCRKEKSFCREFC